MIEVGARVAGFVVERVLGRGAMGAVFAARDASGELVALKTVHEERLADPVIAERFEREARAAALVRARHVVRLRDVVRHEGQTCLVLDLVPGGSLEDRLRRGTLGWREACRLGADVARGLAAIHEAGLVHRDVKPSNCLLDAEGRAVVSDLGLARAVGSAKLVGGTLTRTGELVGTVAYLAPELADDARAVDARADLYGLGATLYHLLAGRPPFDGPPVVVVKKHLTETPPSPRALAPDVPPAVAALVLALLAKDPAARPPSAADVAARLDALAAGAPRRRRRTAPLVVFLLLTIAALASHGSGDAPSPPPPVPSPIAAPSATVAPLGTREPWFLALPQAQRPYLPPGLLPTSVAREYRWQRDGSILVHFPLAGSAGFYLGKHEVTVARFAAFVAATGHRTRAEESGGGYVREGVVDRLSGEEFFKALDKDRVAGVSWRRPRGAGPEQTAAADLPALQLSAVDAAAYCDWAGLDLPTNKHWDVAITLQGQKPSRNMNGNCGRRAEGWGCRPRAAGSSEPDAPGFAHDLSGNAWEWVRARSAPLQRDLAAMGLSFHPERDRGHWAGVVWDLLPEQHFDDTGFRVALDPSRPRRP